MSFSPESAEAKSVIADVEKQHHLDFVNISKDDADLAHDPEAAKLRRELETQYVSLHSQSERFLAQAKMPSSAAMSQHAIDTYMGRVTETGEFRFGENKTEYIRYGRVITGRLRGVFAPDRITRIKDEIEATPENALEEYWQPVLQDIVYGQGDDITELPSSNDPETFQQEVLDSRYFYTDSNTGLTRVHVQKVKLDYDKLNPSKKINDEQEEIMLTPAARELKNFLWDLMQSDVDEFNRNFVLPELAQSMKPESLQKAEGAARALFLLVLVAMGTLSLYMERNKNFPTVAATYLGLATLVYNPTMFSDGPMNRIAKHLAFTIPGKGSPDKWGELMNGKYRADCTGDKGVQLFETLVEPDVQDIHKQYFEKKLTKDGYSKALEENGVDVEKIDVLANMHDNDPKLLEYLAYNTSRLHDEEAQGVLFHYVDKGISTKKLASSIVGTKSATKPDTIYPSEKELGGLGEATLGFG